jgi:Uma2 family endonuclease
MSSATKHLLTIEEFLQLPDNEHLELVRGEVVKTMPPGKEHGMIAVAIARFLSNWSQQGEVGKVGVEFE